MNMRSASMSFFVEDLKRYNIRALLIDEYSEITDILNEISKRLNQNNIFYFWKCKGIWRLYGKGCIRIN